MKELYFQFCVACGGFIYIKQFCYHQNIVFDVIREHFQIAISITHDIVISMIDESTVKRQVKITETKY